MTDIIIDKRFCGPRHSANGGYAAGVFAEAAADLSGRAGPRAVMLKSPPPLDAPIAMRAGDEGAYEAVAGTRLVAEIRDADVAIDLPSMPDEAGVRAAHDRFLEDANGEHLLPFCFVCGNKRAEGDGLRIFSGPAPESVVNADFWTPTADLAGDDGLVRPEFLWAALDCPSAFALRNGLRLSLLGRLAVDIKSRPPAGARLVAAAWRTGEEGRKHFSSSALIDQDGEMVAAANAVWIELNDPAMLERLRAENA